jgi:hypothetical protein
MLPIFDFLLSRAKVVLHVAAGGSAASSFVWEVPLRVLHD